MGVNENDDDDDDNDDDDDDDDDDVDYGDDDDDDKWFFWPTRKSNSKGRPWVFSGPTVVQIIQLFSIGWATSRLST